jgi:hypothetical protein
MRCTIKRSAREEMQMDPSQIIVYAILWTFCFAVTVYALVKSP